MAVFDLGTSQYNKLFNEYILKGMNVMFVGNTIVYDRFKTDTESCKGKYGVMKLATAASKSARPSSSSTFPTARQGSYAEFLFYMKRGMYASLQFDNLAIVCGKDDGAFRDIVQTEIENQAIYIGNVLNRQFWGDGSGRLAVLDAASANSTTVTIDSAIFGLDSNDYTEASSYLEVGQYIDIYSSAGALLSEENEISSITSDSDGTATLVMGTAVTAADNSLIFNHDTYAATEAAGTGVPQGLHSIISTANPYIGITASSAFQNINRSNYPYAQAQAFTMGSSVTAVQSKKVIEAVQKAEKYGRISVMLTNGPIWRCWQEILLADRTLPNETVAWGGTEGLKFYGGRKGSIPIVMDDDCPDQRIYGIDDSAIKVSAPTKSGMEWVPGDNGILTRVQGKDELVASLRWYYNLTVKQPKSLFVISNVKHLES